MTTEPTAILVDDAGRPAYAVPATLLEAHRATTDQRAAVAAAMGDARGVGLAPDAPIHLLTAAELEPFRLSDERRAALGSAADATDEDVAGYLALPGALVVLLPPAGTPPSAVPLLSNTSFRVHTLTFSSNATGIG